jgi:hypothetical protein
VIWARGRVSVGCQNENQNGTFYERQSDESCTKVVLVRTGEDEGDGVVV